MKKTLLFSTLIVLAALPLVWRLAPKKAPRCFTDHGIYKALCTSIAQDEARFREFRRDPLFTLFHENMTREEGAAELQQLAVKAPELLAKLGEMDDRVGSPHTFEYAPHGAFSPMTLRYANIAADLKQRFGSLDGLHLLEVGGGYGGLCAILSSLYSLKGYTIVDLPESLELCAHFLEAQQVENVSFVSMASLPEQKFDLVVSYLAFSEWDRSVQSTYLNKVISHAKAGYLICEPAHWKEIPYNATQHCRVKPLPKEKILSILSAQGIKAQCVSASENFVIFWERKSD